MITDDERREVAQKLRGLPIDMYSTIDEWEKDGLFINNSVSDEGDYSQIHDAVFGYFPAEYMHPCDYEELHARLAELIEPEPERTCHMDPDETASHAMCGPAVRCDACGAAVPAVGTLRYCPNCGAKVVEVVDE